MSVGKDYYEDESDNEFRINDKNIDNAINQYKVNLVPTVIYIDKNGKVVRKTEGYVDKNKFETYVKELLN